MTKNLKKLSVSVLILIMTLMSLTACKKKLSPKEVLEKNLKQSEKITSYRAVGDSSYELKTKDSSSTMTFTMTYNLQNKDMLKDSMQMIGNMKLSMLGQHVDMDMYYKDAYCYVNTMDQKQKMKMDITQIRNQMKNMGIQTGVPAKYYENLKLKEDGDYQILSYNLNADGLNEYTADFKKELDSVFGSGSSSSGSSAGKITKFSGTRTIDKDYNPVKETIKMTLQATETESIHVSLTQTFKDVGKDFKLKFPADLDSYPETTTTTPAQ